MIYSYYVWLFIVNHTTLFNDWLIGNLLPIIFGYFQHCASAIIAVSSSLPCPAHGSLNTALYETNLFVLGYSYSSPRQRSKWRLSSGRSKTTASASSNSPANLAQWLKPSTWCSVNGTSFSNAIWRSTSTSSSTCAPPPQSHTSEWRNGTGPKNLERHCSTSRDSTMHMRSGWYSNVMGKSR